MGTSYPFELAPALLPLPDALAPYPGVSTRFVRKLIAQGKLPAVKIGRAYHVRPADLAALFAPTVRGGDQ